jgi:protein involved in polysaccharide export with SLBB domain
MFDSMKLLSRSCLIGSFLLLAGFFWSGCRHTEQANTINPSGRYVFPGESSATVNATNQPPERVALPPSALGTGSGMLIRAGEKITITFSDLPPPGIQPHEQRVREDGTITLPFNKTVVAAGKTARQLEEDIRNQYVPQLFKRLTLTVKTDERFFYVGGEVKIAARQPYLGFMTVTRAVQAAGDFTDFANRKKIDLIRATGQKHRINWYKAIENPQLDLEVCPGDQIIVRRRWF